MDLENILEDLTRGSLQITQADPRNHFRGEYCDAFKEVLYYPSDLYRSTDLYKLLRHLQHLDTERTCCGRRRTIFREVHTPGACSRAQRVKGGDFRSANPEENTFGVAFPNSSPSTSSASKTTVGAYRNIIYGTNRPLVRVFHCRDWFRDASLVDADFARADADAEFLRNLRSPMKIRKLAYRFDAKHLIVPHSRNLQDLRDFVYASLSTL